VLDPPRFLPTIALMNHNPLSIDDDILTRTLQSIGSSGVDDADIYMERSASESLSLEEGRVKQIAASQVCGVGIGAVRGDVAALASTDRFDGDALQGCADAVRAIGGSGTSAVVDQSPRAATGGALLYDTQSPLGTLPLTLRKEKLEQIDALARALDPRVVQVFAALVASYVEVALWRLDGVRMHDRRPLVRLNVTVIVAHKGQRETGTFGGGGRFGLERLLDGGEPERFTREAVRLALLNLDAEAAPAGTMPVVLGCGWPGILLHEAVGHGLEGDFNRKKSSVFSGKIGEQVAARGVTVVDDGTMVDRRGSLNVDDEGTATQRTVLIEDGVLQGYLFDRHNAHLMGETSTGNGRRQSYAHPVLPRMTNTFMESGSCSAEEIIASIDHGIYAANFGGGQVDITSGNFVFTTSEAYRVEKGEIIAPVKGATLAGNGAEALKKIVMIGDDLAFDPGVGTCGKAGQSVPVGVGVPTLRIEGLVVGGTGG